MTRDLTDVASGLAPLHVAPDRWTVPWPLPGQRIDAREWLVREFKAREDYWRRRINPRAADAWKEAAEIVDLVLSIAPNEVDFDVTTGMSTL